MQPTVIPCMTYASYEVSVWHLVELLGIGTKMQTVASVTLLQQALEKLQLSQWHVSSINCDNQADLARTVVSSSIHMIVGLMVVSSLTTTFLFFMPFYCHTCVQRKRLALKKIKNLQQNPAEKKGGKCKSNLKNQHICYVRITWHVISPVFISTGLHYILVELWNSMNVFSTYLFYSNKWRFWQLL